MITLKTTNKEDQFALIIRGQIIMLDREEVKELGQTIEAFRVLNNHILQPNKPYFERLNSTMKSKG